MQLMLETNEMATRQRSLMAENQSLRLKSSLRGVDALIGRKLCDTLRPIVSSCNAVVDDFQLSLEQQTLEFPTAVSAAEPVDELGKTLISTSVKLFENLKVKLDTAVLCDTEADDIIDKHVKSLDGFSMEELFDLQLDSPRTDGVFTLSGLKQDLIGSRDLTVSISNAEKVLRALWSNQKSLREEVMNMAVESSRLRYI